MHASVADKSARSFSLRCDVIKVFSAAINDGFCALSLDETADEKAAVRTTHENDNELLQKLQNGLL